MKTLLGENTYFSVGMVVLFLTVVVWAVRQEAHSSEDAIIIQGVATRLDDHERRQNGLESETLQYLRSIDQRLSRIEGSLKAR